MNSTKYELMIGQLRAYYLILEHYKCPLERARINNAIDKLWQTIGE